MRTLLIILALSAAAFAPCQTTPSAAPDVNSSDRLTLAGLRAWADAGGFLAANASLIHQQMQRQRADLPPWWPEDVFAREEAAENIDYVPIALPFYQGCFTNSQALLIAKLEHFQLGR